MQVAGVDGWRLGWVVVTLEEGRFVDAWVAGDAAQVVARAAGAAVIGIDIPIGLPSEGTRACDRQARQLLGRRGASVFPTPPRPVLELASYAEANALCRSRFGFGISRQSFNLRNKILEVDGLRDARLREVHPELGFQAMAGESMPSKKTWAGVHARLAALARVGIEVPKALGEAGVVPVDDVLDAAAAAWTAHRVTIGEAVSVPEMPEVDESGTAMAIWY